MIKINTKGIILNGEYKDWYLFIEDLDEGLGPYLILLNSPDNKEGYDNWVENYESLKGYFHEANWEVSWMNEDHKK